jgi:hypothetical protein
MHLKYCRLSSPTALPRLARHAWTGVCVLSHSGQKAALQAPRSTHVPAVVYSNEICSMRLWLARSAAECLVPIGAPVATTLQTAMGVLTHLWVQIHGLR